VFYRNKLGIRSESGLVMAGRRLSRCRSRPSGFFRILANLV